MHLLLKVSSLLAVLALVTVGNASPVIEPATFIVSQQEMSHWLANTDAKLTFLGDPLNPLTRRAAETTTVTYCNKRVGNVCGGTCTVYTGGAKCLNAPNTSCLFATNNVGFCDHTGCTGKCHQFSSCGTRLDNGFCSTPGTLSIVVSAA